MLTTSPVPHNFSCVDARALHGTPRLGVDGPGSGHRARFFHGLLLLDVYMCAGVCCVLGVRECVLLCMPPRSGELCASASFARKKFVLNAPSIC